MQGFEYKVDILSLLENDNCSPFAFNNIATLHVHAWAGVK